MFYANALTTAKNIGLAARYIYIKAAIRCQGPLGKTLVLVAAEPKWLV
jgi:hypothetical protein